MNNTMVRLLRCTVIVSGISLSAAACEDDGRAAPGGADELSSRKLISTWYMGTGLMVRTIFAKEAPEGTYNVRISSKTIGNGTCEMQTSIMHPVPQGEIESTICAGFGLIFKVFDGGVHGCVTEKSSNIGIPVYRFIFDSWNQELNYEVIDLGDGKILGSSGWQPGEPNGCHGD